MFAFLAEESPSLIPILLNFRAQAEQFNKPHLFSAPVMQSVEPASWWRNVDEDNAHVKVEILPE